MPGNNRTSLINRLQEPWGRGLFPSLASGLFGATVAMRNAAYDAGYCRLSGTDRRPAISVGGVSAGGSGKTPMALLIGKYAHARGREVVFLSRGYGRKSKDTIISPPNTIDSWETVGDEPAMLHAALPASWLGVGGSRARTVSKLTPLLTARSVFILDDAFQHRQMKRDLDVVCLPPDPFKDSLMPSGTLREPLSGLKRAQCACFIGTKDEAELLETSKEKIARIFPQCAVFILYQTPAGWVNASSGTFQVDLPIKNPIALCGIARPQRFIFFLKKMSIFTSAEAIFSDHHEFRNDEIESVAARAGSSGIVTTEKDAFRLKSLKLVSCPDIWYLKLDLRFSDRNSEDFFYTLIDKTLK
jgi:tetraacyldisaccharide 4'-kinase